MSEAPAVPEGFKKAHIQGGFVELSGPLYVKRDGTGLWIGFRVEPRHCNLMGFCHGGMMATFCDMLVPMSVHRTESSIGMRFLPTISLQIDYLAPAPLGAWVQGQCEVLRTTRSLVFAQGLVTADGTAVARTSGVFKIGAPLPPRQEDAG